MPLGLLASALLYAIAPTDRLAGSSGVLNPHASVAHSRTLSATSTASLLMDQFVAVNTADLTAEQVQKSVEIGVSLGITAVDFHLGTSANGLREREGVAGAVKSLGRSALTLITKLDKPPSEMTDPSDAAELTRQTLEDEFTALGVDHVDLLMAKDSATCAVMQAQWSVLEEYLAAGKTSVLGTYNYCEFCLRCLLANATTPPAFNFLMRHVGMGPDKTGLIARDSLLGIQTVVYGTLGEPVALFPVLTSSVLVKIAATHSKSVEAVAMQWNWQCGHSVTNRITADYAPDNVPNSTSHCSNDCKAALSDMADLGKWSLTEEEMKQIDALRFNTFPQSPTYYSSTACNFSYSTVDYPTESACNISRTSDASWC